MDKLLITMQNIINKFLKELKSYGNIKRIRNKSSIDKLNNK